MVTDPLLQTEDDMHKVPAMLNKNFTVSIEFYSNNDDGDAVATFLLENNTQTVSSSFIEKGQGDVRLPVHGQFVTTTGIHVKMTHTITSQDEFGVFHIKIQNDMGAVYVPLEVVPEGKWSLIIIAPGFVRCNACVQSWNYLWAWARSVNDLHFPKLIMNRLCQAKFAVLSLLLRVI